MKIFLNPGHDQDVDSGAVSPYDGTREADVVAKLGLLLAAKLQAADFTVQSKQNDDLEAVVEAANSWPADIFVALHCNASPAHDARGTETLYRSEQGRVLAECVQNCIVAQIATTDRGCKLRTDLYVLNATTMPAILIELAFIDAYGDLALLKNSLPTYAEAITKGISNYFTKGDC
ncbi:MAG: N-acetylmuramoyl-L-alanine amidase [Acidaminococcaceae bacterium]|nr:N-acetylmuramoyl-L-alanine amidase [Acidaminococcaceae bacterium]